MPGTFSFYSAVFYRSFAAYTTRQLQQLGLNFGALFLVLYVGKHPGCTQAQLTQALGLDWGHSQRSVAHLVEAGFMTREKSGRAYHLTLSEKGQQAFSVSHQVFFDWDEQVLAPLTGRERQQLLSLLAKAAHMYNKESLCINTSEAPSTTAESH